MELITGYLIGASLGFFILYTREVLRNNKLEKERDIETFEKNKLEKKVKKLEKIIDKLKENERNKIGIHTG